MGFSYMFDAYNNRVIINEGNKNYWLNLNRTGWKRNTFPVLHGKYKGKNIYFINSREIMNGGINVINNLSRITSRKGRKVKVVGSPRTTQKAARFRSAARRSKNSPKRTMRIPRTNLN